jgi:Family of unknown function (DUF5677)
MPTTFQEEGFFSDEAEQVRKQIFGHDKQLFNFHKDLTLLVHQFRRGLEVVPDNGKLVIAAALLARAIAAYEAMVFLAMRGFGSETRVSCRSIMEAMFKLAYLLVKPESLTLIIGESERNRRNRLQRMKDGKAPVLEEYFGDIDALIAAAEANAAKWPRATDIAEQTSLQEHYYGPYNLLSESVHAGARELENYLEFDSNQKVVGYRYDPERPEDGILAEITIQGAGYLLTCVECVTWIFEFDNVSDALNLRKRMEDRFKGMVERYRDIGVVSSRLRIRPHVKPPAPAEGDRTAPG